ncbi:MAG TPA: hypothetical protein DCZ61_03875 [Lachnospiraceae bacterium]|nr:hypothetical protein [Lachnospiraceae bacterium]
MTNKDKFKRAFSALHTSDSFTLEQENTTMTKKISFHKTAAAACTALAIFAGAATCYAADAGGIQRTIQVWLHGDQTTAVITVDDDNVTHYGITDKNGNQLQGGGVAIDEDGKERALTDSEIQEHLDSPSTDTINGKLYLFYKDQKTDLTDKFDADGLAYITLKDGGKTLYVTVAENGGLQSSAKCYPQKRDLPQEWFE